MTSLCVVIPTRNESALLPGLLERLTRADDALDRADRVIVSDGESDDPTPAIARSFGATVIAAAPGRGTQLARGASEASEDLLLFLHADTLPGPGALIEVRRAYEDPVVAITSMRQRIAADGRFYRWVESGANARSRRGIVYGDSGLALRRTVYERSGGFRDIPLFEDLDISRRLRERWQIHYLQDAELLISARRWKREGALRCTLRNWILKGAYFAGCDPERLARFYAPPASTEVTS